MSSYKRNAGQSRDALFGPSSSSGTVGTGGAAYRKEHGANRDALFGGAGGPGGAGGGGGKGVAGARRPAAAAAGGSRGPAPASAASRPKSRPTPRTGSNSNSNSSGGLTGQARAEKMAEAESYRAKAKKAMERGFFSSPDPIAAGSYYKRAADAYRACGENRLERLHRIASADCQMGQDAYATAATEYVRAAELAGESEEAAERKRAEVHKVYRDAAEAWRQCNEPARAADCEMRAALGLLIGREPGDGSVMMNMDKKALTAIEEAVEMHVPDLLNKYGRYRQTGTSAYVDPDADPGDTDAEAEAMRLAKEGMVTKSYAHEACYRTMSTLIQYGEYPSALYAAGAATALIGADGFATISLSRAFAAETVLTLASGDVVAAEKYFLEIHLQKDSYLKSRECKLSEDLIMAVKDMDGEALEEARDPGGPNRAALANLDPALRRLVAQLRVSGRAGRAGAGGGGGYGGSSGGGVVRAKPGKPAAPAAAASSRPPARETATAAPAANQEGMLEGTELKDSLDANFAELDGLMDGMGLGGSGREEEEEDVGVGVGSDASTAATGPSVPASAPCKAYYEEDDDDDLDIDLR